MTTDQFKSNYYLKRSYEQVSPTEFHCKLNVYLKSNNQEISGIETKINTTDIGQAMEDSQFSLTPISSENYLNQTITILFNMLMFRFNITDLYNTDGQNEISEFFDENPFHEEK